LSRPRALIVDQGAYRSSVAAARALRDGGWIVGAASPGAGLAGSSRAVSRRHVIVSLAVGEDAFIASLAAVAVGYDIVLPGDEATMLAISARRAELDAEVPYAEHAVVVRCADKLELVRAAERVGLAVPATVPAEDARPSWPGPVVVKPRSSARATAALVADTTSATTRLAELEALGVGAVLQEVVEGRLGAVAIVSDRDRRVVAASQQQAIRTWPLDTGISAYARTVPVDETLLERIEALVGDLGWFGLAQLQFLTPKDGVPRLIDFNGRFYGSLALAVAAGANLPAVWADLAVGRNAEPTVRARPGVRYQWFTHDLRAGGLRAALRAAPGSVHTLLDFKDPGPFFRYYVTILRERPRP
jgi:predicted ATP-grasp superfamily ATP-dependent carboligase